MRKFLILLMLPGLLWAQADSKLGSKLTVKTAKMTKTETPLHMIRRVSKSTGYLTTYQDSAHFARKEYNEGTFNTDIHLTPIRWNDNGTYRDYDLSKKPAKTKGYQELYQFGPSTVELDSSLNMRYEKGGLWFEVNPLFKGVKAVVEPQPSQMKATYFIERPDTLVWTLADPYRIARRKILPFTAKDAAGKVIVLTEERTDTSLSVRIKNPWSVTLWPVALDPTIIDSADVTTGTSRMSWTAARVSVNPWGVARDSTFVNGTYWWPNWKAGGTSIYVGPYSAVGPTGGLYRKGFAYDLTALDPAAVVDSVRFTFISAGTFPSDAADSAYFQLVEGTWGDQPDSLKWWSSFRGWKAGPVAYGVADTAYSDSFLVMKGSAGARSVLFNTFGKTALTTTLGHDTLRFVMLSQRDINNDFVFVNSVEQHDMIELSAPAPYLTISYTISNLPGVSTFADTLKPAILLVAEIDSTGGINATSVSFMLWPKGATLAGDTITLTKTGSFGAGNVTMYCDSLLPDTLYRWKFAATNTKGTTWTALDSFSTTLTGSGTTTSVYVDGRRVDHVR